jgi:succinate-semialdehyde dehydrogenase/glutarate-semialdehyde dehydrogenase
MISFALPVLTGARFRSPIPAKSQTNKSGERNKMYPDVSLHINGQWTKGAEGRSEPILNPATGEKIGTLAHATKPDLDMALQAADDGFKVWKKTPADTRYKTLRKAADIIRSRADDIAKIMVMEQGKPLMEAKGETLLAGDIMDWFGEEARRTYGRVIPARMENVYQLVVKEPVGPVAAFTPWNFPINQVVR